MLIARYLGYREVVGQSDVGRVGTRRLHYLTIR